MAAPDYRGLWHTEKPPPCLVSREDLRRLYRDLNEKTAEALERHLSTLQQPPDDEQAKQFEEAKGQVRNESPLSVNVRGHGGEQLFAYSEDGLADDVLPERISWMTLESAFATRARFNFTPANRFKVHLDFTEPPGFDTYNPWDQPTPNQSEIEVVGDDTTWVRGVRATIDEFFKHRKRRRSWLHTQTFFNAAHWLLGFPVALWIIYRLDAALGVFSTMHAVLRGAIYVYVFLVALLLFRVLIWLLRWTYPVVELEGARSTVRRGIVNAGVGALLLSLLYDVLKAIFT